VENGKALAQSAFYGRRRHQKKGKTNAKPTKFT